MKLKKKASPAHTYSWRPNFRNYDTLPEMRAVRTQFFVPAVAIGIAAVFAIFIGFHEFRAININKSIATLKEEVAGYETSHDEKVQLNADFMAINRVLDEVTNFESGNLIASDYLLAVSSALQDGLYLNRIEYLDGKATINGSALVSAEQASRLVNEFKKALEEADALQGLLTEYQLTSLERDGASNTIKFRIEVTNPEEEGKK